MNVDRGEGRLPCLQGCFPDYWLSGMEDLVSHHVDAVVT